MRDNTLQLFVPGEDEEWSDSEKTPSVSSGLEGGGSAVSSPSGAGQLVDQDELVALPPPPRLNLAASLAPDDIRLRLSVLPDDARKRLASLTEDYEVSSNLHFHYRYSPNDFKITHTYCKQKQQQQQRNQHPSRPNSVQDSSPKSHVDEDSNMAVREEENSSSAGGGRASSASSSSSGAAAAPNGNSRRCSRNELTTTTNTTTTTASRRDSEDSRRSSDEVTLLSEAKRPRLDDELSSSSTTTATAPRLRLNTSLATDPALRPQAVAALTIKPESAASPPNLTSSLPPGLQNGNTSLVFYSFFAYQV